MGDIGNNFGTLPIRAIYRIDEPDPAVPQEKPLAVSSATFYALPSANRFDAESLIVDRGTATLVAKYHDGREAELFSVPLVAAVTLAPASPASFDRPAAGLHGARDGRRPE